jgi:hypothetical protein
MLNTELAVNTNINIQTVQKICHQLTSSIVDNKPGIDEECLQHLINTRRELELVNDTQNNHIGFVSSGRNLLNDLEEKGIDQLSTNPDETYLAVELLDALIATSNFINKTDPKGARDRIYQGSDYVDIATLANIEFLDFFIKVHQKFKFSDGEMEDLCKLIFREVGLDSELKRKALENFPGGVVAALRAYLKISSKLPNWNISVSSLELDKGHGVDLIAISPDKNKKYYFEIKGKTRYSGVNILKATTKEECRKVEDRIYLSEGKSDISKDLASLYKVHDFVNGQRKKGIDAYAFWVEANSAF